MDNTQTSETDKPTLNAKTDEHERFNAENYIATRLKHEMEYYDNRADGYRNRIGDYDNTSDKDAKQLLVKRTEGILYYDIASTLQFSQKGSPNAADDEKKDATNASKTD